MHGWSEAWAKISSSYCNRKPIGLEYRQRSSRLVLWSSRFDSRQGHRMSWPWFSVGPCRIYRQHCKITHKNYRKLGSIFRAWIAFSRWVNGWMHVYGLTYSIRSVYLNSCCEIKVQRESPIMFTSVGLELCSHRPSDSTTTGALVLSCFNRSDRK